MQQVSGYVLPFGSGDGGGPEAGVENSGLLEVAGGKGTSLLRLAAGGQPVPAGFVLTTHAYRDFVAEQALAAGIVAAARADELQDNAGIEAAASRIRALFMQAPLGERIRAEVAAAWRGLCARVGASDDLAVAVRSSANAEDLPELSFAGQQDSWLNVRGEAAVLAAVQRC